MTDPVTTPSETPNQPAVETPAPVAAAAATAKPAVSSSSTSPTVETPAPAADPAAAAKPATEQPAADTAAAAAAKAAAPAAGDPAAKPTPEAEAAAAAAKVAADAAAAAAIPETYAIELPKPMVEKGMQLDPALLPALTPALKKAGLTQTQLQTVAESFLEFQAGLPQRMLDRDLEVTGKDPVIGGMRYAQTLKEVNLAIDAFGDPDFKKFVLAAGIGNRLEFVRVFQRIGEAMAKSGDTPSRGQPDGAPELSMAERMYGRNKRS